MKLRSYTSRDKVWFNSKYFKTKKNQKLKIKFFGLFCVLYLVKKQVHNLELPKKWTIYEVFHKLLLKQDTTKKKQMDKPNAWLEFDDGKGKGGKYKVKKIWNNAVYTKESEIGSHLPDLYYLVS